MEDQSRPQGRQIWINEWPIEKTALLKLLWADLNKSASDIALEMRCTRNAVLGKVHRMGLKSRKAGASRLRTPQDTRRYRPRKVRSTEAPVIVDTLPVDQSNYAVSLFDATDTQCRWPLNDPGFDFLFCGAPQKEGCSYCARHAAVAFNRTPARTGRPFFSAIIRKTKMPAVEALQMLSGIDEVSDAA